MEDRDERRRKASALLGGGPLTPEEIESDYVLRGVPKPPREGYSSPLCGALAPALDIPAIRRAAQEGGTVTAGQVLALVDRVERAEASLEASLDFSLQALARTDNVLCCARAWADAIERVDSIAAAEEQLLKAIKAL